VTQPQIANVIHFNDNPRAVYAKNRYIASLPFPEILRLGIQTRVTTDERGVRTTVEYPTSATGRDLPEARRNLVKALAKLGIDASNAQNIGY
jgi:hypothetical protein